MRTVITRNYRTAGFTANYKEEWLLIHKPHTHSSPHNFYHASYISSVPLAQKFSLNTQELKQSKVDIFTQGYRGVARKPAEH